MIRYNYFTSKLAEAVTLLTFVPEVARSNHGGGIIILARTFVIPLGPSS
jgi:hypothetical protein